MYILTVARMGIFLKNVRGYYEPLKLPKNNKIRCAFILFAFPPHSNLGHLKKYPRTGLSKSVHSKVGTAIIYYL